MLKAPDDGLVVEAATRLEGRHIPVVTLVTDRPASRRIAYVGMDDRAVGATAAYLLTAVAPGPGGVLVTLSRSSFRGEEQRHPDIDTVYSVGGGNRAILAAFDQLGRAPRAVVAHDLDDDNVALLRQRRLAAVLHHDLRADMRQARRAVLQAHGAVPGRPTSRPSQIQVITPYNEPAGLLDSSW